jgi:hypothetical protein
LGEDNAFERKIPAVDYAEKISLPPNPTPNLLPPNSSPKMVEVSSFHRHFSDGRQWFTSIILATLEAEIIESRFEASPGK